MSEALRQLLFLPPAATEVARDIDQLHFVVIGISFVGSMAVMATLLIFLYRFRSGRGRHEAELGVPRRIEFGVAGFILSLFLAFWFVGYRQYLTLARAPEGTEAVYGTAKQWMWKFSYPDGRITVGFVVVPQGEATKLALTSRDVIHSFYVPAFRLKQDVLPGRFTALWFKADRAGTYQAMCAEYCGTSHSAMWADVVVLSKGDYAAWRGGSMPEPVARAQANAVASPPPERYGGGSTLIEDGRDAAERYGCLTCHSIDGTEERAPSWRGLYGSERTDASGGPTVVDEDYLVESMLKPQSVQSSKWKAAMPPYSGVLEPYDITTLIAYIKSLEAEAPEAPR